MQKVKHEAVSRLSNDFTATHPDVDWSRIYGMRCHLVHGYDMFDAEIAWDAIKTLHPPVEEILRTPNEALTNR